MLRMRRVSSRTTIIVGSWMPPASAWAVKWSSRICCVAVMGMVIMPAWWSKLKVSTNRASCGIPQRSVSETAPFWVLSQRAAISLMVRSMPEVPRPAIRLRSSPWESAQRLSSWKPPGV